MGKNRQPRKDAKIKQDVLSAPKYILKERYLCPKGKKLFVSGLITKKEADKKYGKNRYEVNPEAKYVKTITHSIFHK